MVSQHPGSTGGAERDVEAALLRVRHLTVVFDGTRGPVRAVDDVGFEIRRGETLGLVGESGSGKSVTALSLVRLVRQPGRIAAGSVVFQGRDLLGLPEPEMRRVRGAGIGFVFQEPASALNPVFTIGDQIAEVLTVHGKASGSEARRRAVERLAAVRMPEPERRALDYPHQLSGGMRQRALIAVALACDPSLLIADEPTTALDATIQGEILDLLREMKTRLNLAVLLITHDLGVVAGNADRVAVMYAGRIVEEAGVQAIFESPAHPYTRGLLASIPGVGPGRRLHAIEGAAPDLAALPPGCAFGPRCPDRFSRCDVEAPDPYAVAPGHAARCFLCQRKAV